MKSDERTEYLLAGMAFANVDLTDVSATQPEVQALLDAIKKYGKRSPEVRRIVSNITDTAIGPDDSMFESIAQKTSRVAKMEAARERKRIQGRLGVCEKCRNLMDVSATESSKSVDPELLRWVAMLGMALMDPILFEDVTVEDFPEEFRPLVSAVKYSEWTDEAIEILRLRFSVTYQPGVPLFTRFIQAVQ